MDLSRYQVLIMKCQTLAEIGYLFIVAGDFSTRDKPG
jgi:hypothetical protein